MNADVLALASNWLAKADNFCLPTSDEAQACLRVALAGRDFVGARLRAR
jgi:hypothetical protein